MGATAAALPANRRRKHGVIDEDRERIFVDAYMANFNGAQAAIAAGYAAKSASVAGSTLLARPNVIKLLSERRDALMKKHDVTLDKIMMEWKLIGFANMQDYTTIDSEGHLVLDLSKCNRDQLAVVSEMTTDIYMEGKGEDAREVKRVKMKLHSKLEALDKMMRCLGGYEGKEAPTYNVNQTIINNDNRVQTMVNLGPAEAAKEYTALLEG